MQIVISTDIGTLNRQDTFRTWMRIEISV